MLIFVQLCKTIDKIFKCLYIKHSDESIISYLSLFYLDFMCFYLHSRTILVQLQVIQFHEQIYERLSLGAKERRFGAVRAKKMKILCKNIRHSPCLGDTGRASTYQRKPSHQKGWHGPCLQWHGRARPPSPPFPAFASRTSYLFSLFLT